jgi:hypothetical protein
MEMDYHTSYYKSAVHASNTTQYLAVHAGDTTQHIKYLKQEIFGSI